MRRAANLLAARGDQYDMSSLRQRLRSPLLAGHSRQLPLFRISRQDRDRSALRHSRPLVQGPTRM